jgi:hypothetical protein
MPEGRTAVDEHPSHAGPDRGAGHDGARERPEHWITISEAVLLSLVTLAAAWSGYSAAKWSTHSSVTLAKASAERAKSNRAFLTAMELRNLDSTFFNAWLNAYGAGNDRVMAISERRFRPAFRVAFNAWRATKPETNPHAPPGPTYMPQYKQPAQARAVVLDARATAAFNEGSDAGATADKYVRTTVLLATVLFLVGLSTHFPLQSVRYGLVGLGAVLLIVSVVQLLTLPRNP